MLKRKKEKCKKIEREGKGVEEKDGVATLGMWERGELSHSLNQVF